MSKDDSPLSQKVWEKIQLREPTPKEREFIQMWEIVFSREKQVRQRDERIKNLLAILAREQHERREWEEECGRHSADLDRRIRKLQEDK